MNCMKCGAEIPETQVFCDHCLELMEQYPIKPGTHIHLPKQNLVPTPPRKPVKKKRVPTPEEQISALRMKVLRLRLAVVILIFVVCVVSGLLGLKLYQQYMPQNIVRNYTIDTTMNG